MRHALPLEVLGLVCAELAAAGRHGTLAAVLASSRGGYAAAAPHLYASLVIGGATFARLVAGLPLRAPGTAGFDVVPLARAALPPPPPQGWPGAASAARKRALLARCTHLTLEGWPAVELFGQVCVGEAAEAAGGAHAGVETGTGSDLFPRVRSVAIVAGRARFRAALPCGLALAALGVAHPLLGLLARVTPQELCIRFPPGTSPADLRELAALAWRPDTLTLHGAHAAAAALFPPRRLRIVAPPETLAALGTLGYPGTEGEGADVRADQRGGAVGARADALDALRGRFPGAAVRWARARRCGCCGAVERKADSHSRPAARAEHTADDSDMRNPSVVA